MSGELKIERKKKIAASQILTMAEYFEKNPGLVAVRNNDMCMEKKDELWENLKNILNSDLAGSIKTVERWQKSWSDLKSQLRKKHELHLKNPRDVFLKDVELRLLKIISDSKESVPTLPIKMESCDSSEIMITSVESQQGTSSATIEDIQPTISSIQPQIVNNNLLINQNPIVNNNQKQDSGQSLSQFLDTVYFYCKQPTVPALLVTTQNVPQPNGENNPDKSCSSSLLQENSEEILPTTSDKSSVCQTDLQGSDRPISTLQDKSGKRQYSAVIGTDNQDSDITQNPEKRMTYDTRIRNLLAKSPSKEVSQTSGSQRKVQDLLNSKSSSKEKLKSSGSQTNGSVEKMGFFSCQMMSAKALQTIAKELEVKNDIERKRLELEERKIKAFERIAQLLQM